MSLINQRLWIVLLLQFALLIIIKPKQAKAETCIRTFEIDTTYANAIFVGKIVDKIEKKFWFNQIPASIYTFEIIESYKGLESYIGYLSLLDAYMQYSNTQFTIDSTYLIFAYSNCGKSHLLYTQSCSHTGLLSEKKNLLSKLNPPKKHIIRNYSQNYFKNDQLLIDSLINKNTVLNTQLKEASTMNKKLEYGFGVSCVIIFFIAIWVIKNSLLRK